MTSEAGVGGVILSALKDTHDSARAEVFLRPSRAPLSEEQAFTCWFVGGLILGVGLDAVLLWGVCILWRRAANRPRR